MNETEMTWYRTYGNHAAIEPVDIISFTEKTVTLKNINGGTAKPVRVNRESSWHSYFPTWEEAKERMLEEAQRKVVTARRQLENANSSLGNIKGLKNVPIPPLPKLTEAML